MKWPGGYLSLGRWRGVPILAHAAILLSLPYFYWRTRDLDTSLVLFCVYGVLLLVHELGHAAVSRWRQVRVHGIELLLFHGRCRHARPNHESDDVLIAWGGVAAQFVVLLLTWAMSVIVLRYAPPQLQWQVLPVANLFAEVNIFTLLFNLLPIEPLDGAKAWRAIPLLYRRLRGAARKPAPELNGPRFRTQQEIEEESQTLAANVVTDLRAYAERRQKRRRWGRWLWR